MRVRGGEGSCCTVTIVSCVIMLLLLMLLLVAACFEFEAGTFTVLLHVDNLIMMIMMLLFLFNDCRYDPDDGILLLLVCVAAASALEAHAHGSSRGQSRRDLWCCRCRHLFSSPNALPANSDSSPILYRQTAIVAISHPPPPAITYASPIGCCWHCHGECFKHGKSPLPSTRFWRLSFKQQQRWCQCQCQCRHRRPLLPQRQ